MGKKVPVRTRGCPLTSFALDGPVAPRCCANETPSPFCVVRVQLRSVPVLTRELAACRFPGPALPVSRSVSGHDMPARTSVCPCHPRGPTGMAGTSILGSNYLLFRVP